ncbi:MAG: 4-amino-4-deoxy-L-arabinose transferase, partial [Phenylobacterium sp.]|nr:4-amino-4-deoxy-L-arabinose transferase [Phenylobacterium sp.]
FGPIPFAVLIGGAVVMAARRRLTREDVLLLCFALPPLLIVATQAFISRANANWSGAAYLPGAVLAATWLLRWRARRWLAAAVILQAVLAMLFWVWCVAPHTAEAMGMANSFKRAKGWSQMTDAVIDRARSEHGLTAIAVNNRFLYNAMAYYARDYLRRPDAPPLTIWLLEATPQNQAETTAPLNRANGARVLAVSLEQTYRDRMVGDFTRVSGQEFVGVRLDRKRSRRAEMFIGEGFAPRPRAALSGPPTQP